MAVFPDPQSVLNAATGIVTNNPLLNQFATQLPAAGGLTQDLTEWDRWRMLMTPPPTPPGTPKREPSAPFYILHGGAPPAPRYGPVHPNIRQAEEDQSKREAKERAFRTEAFREHKLISDEQRKYRSRLTGLAKDWYGRDATPAEMHKLWLAAVDEAEAAAQIGIKLTPWDVLEDMAQREDRPGATRGPRTTTSTHTTINLTDPKTAQGIIQVALRDALGRRATDEEMAQFRAALNSTERANPTVTTSTSTTTPDGDTTSSSTTTGGAPSPTAVAQSWLDEELNAEIDVYRAATEYFQVAQALAGGIV